MGQVLPEELKSLAEFPSEPATLIDEIGDKAFVYTDEGAQGAVILDLAAYRAMQEELALLHDIQQADREIIAEKGVPHDQALDVLLSRLDA